MVNATAFGAVCRGFESHSYSRKGTRSTCRIVFVSLASFGDFERGYMLSDNQPKNPHLPVAGVKVQRSRCGYMRFLPFKASQPTPHQPVADVCERAMQGCVHAQT